VGGVAVSFPVRFRVYRSRTFDIDSQLWTFSFCNSCTGLSVNDSACSGMLGRRLRDIPKSCKSTIKGVIRTCHRSGRQYPGAASRPMCEIPECALHLQSINRARISGQVGTVVEIAPLMIQWPCWLCLQTLMLPDTRRVATTTLTAHFPKQEGWQPTAEILLMLLN
jgi:hypothetical protein